MKINWQPVEDGLVDENSYIDLKTGEFVFDPNEAAKAPDRHVRVFQGVRPPPHLTDERLLTVTEKVFVESARRRQEREKRIFAFTSSDRSFSTKLLQALDDPSFVQGRLRFRDLLKENELERARYREQVALSEKEDLWRWASSLPRTVDNLPDWVSEVGVWREAIDLGWRAYVANLIVRLANAVRTKAPKVFERLRPPAAEGDIASLESYLGFQIPETLKDLYRWHDGMDSRIHGSSGVNWSPEGFFFGNCFAQLNLVRDHHEMKTRMMRDGTYVSTQRGGMGWWDPTWIPFLQNDQGASYCVDMGGSFTGTSGHVLQEWHDDPSRPIEYVDIDAWLETFVGALELGILSYNDQYGSIMASDDGGSGHERWVEYHRRHNLSFPMRVTARP